MAASPEKLYKIHKKPLSGYRIKPRTPDSQAYAVEIGDHGSTQEPFMFLHEGTSTKDIKTAVGSVRRLPDEAAFEVVPNGLQHVDDVGCPTMMRKTMTMTADLEVGMSVGKPRDLAWRPIVGRGVVCKLLDTADEDIVVAKYEESSILGRGGTLTLNVDWGLDFERIVIMTAISMFERTSVWARYHAARPAAYAGFPAHGVPAAGVFAGGFGGGGGGGDGGGGGVGGC